MAKQKFNLKVPTKTSESTQPTSKPFDSINSAASSEKEPAAKPKASTSAPISIMKEEISRPIVIKYIPRTKIVFNENNDYSQEEIEKLAESILHYGLIHIMEAYYDEENDVYILESGERRTRAIDLLLERYLSIKEEDTDSYEYQCFLKNVKGFANGYPLNVKRPETIDNGELTELEKINSLLRLDEANMQVRIEDPLQKAKALERRKELLQKKNNLLPKTSRVNINKKLAEETGIKERTIMKYTAVAERLIPELQEEFRKNNISLNEGSAYAQLTEDEQRYILQMLQNGEKASRKELEQLRERNQQQELEKEAKEAELEKLKEEKAVAEKKLKEKIEAEETERIELEKRLRQEIASDIHANEAAIAALEKALQKKNKELDNSKKALQDHIQEKDIALEALQKKLKELKEKPAIDANEQKILRLTITYETAIQNLKAAVDTSFKAYKELVALVPEKEEALKQSFLEAINKFSLR